MRFIYAAEKLSDARRILMLPHLSGEAEDISLAFGEIHNGLDKLPRELLDESALRWVQQLDQLLDYSTLDDPQGEGGWIVKARILSYEEKSELSTAVDELAHWFKSALWQEQAR